MLDFLYKAINDDEMAKNPMETDEVIEAATAVRNLANTMIPNCSIADADKIAVAISLSEEAHKKAGFYVGFTVALKLLLQQNTDILKGVL